VGAVAAVVLGVDVDAGAAQGKADVVAATGGERKSGEEGDRDGLHDVSRGGDEFTYT